MAIPLTAEQFVVAKIIRAKWASHLKDFHSARGTEKGHALLREAADAAHELYKQLVVSNRPPSLAPGLVKNRRLAPTHQDFFFHAHTIEALLSAIECQLDPEELRRLRHPNK
jgi:hypothetical protein